MSNVNALINQAAKQVGVMWPLDRAVAVNPLLDSQEQNFEEAIGELQRQLGTSMWPTAEHIEEAKHRGLPVNADIPHDGMEVPSARPETMYERNTSDELLKHQTRHFIGEVLLEATTMENTAGVDLIKRAIKVLHSYTSWSVTSHKVHTQVAQLLSQNNLEQLIDLLGNWSEAEITEEFRRHFARLPGWAAWAKWNDDWARGTHSARLTRREFLTLSLAIDVTLLHSQKTTEILPPNTPEVGESRAGIERLVALENATYDEILSAMKRESVGDATATLQVVTCIDVRSEPLRRALELDSRVQTFGFAGFFGIPAEIQAPGESEAYEALPVLVSPTVTVNNLEAEFADADLELRMSELFAHLTHEPRAMFALAEGAGWFGLPYLAYKKLKALAVKRHEITPITHWKIHSDSQVAIAEGALRGMGLTKNFAPTVLFLGHGSTTAANPHFATLDCGACAGHSGGPNAQVLADILNRKETREELQSRGIAIPSTTRFMAGEHNKTTETVVIFGEQDPAVAEIVKICSTASHVLAVEREVGANSVAQAQRTLRRKSKDWAETRPEWGLANHVSFVISDREAMRGAKLNGQSFLHSYDVAQDQDGLILRSILAAPVVVAHWINMSYYFSTVAPDVLGAGDKSLLNPVGDFAVIRGDDPDLRLGLPWQSVAAATSPYHLPVRLLVAIAAPLDRIAAAIAAEPIVSRLVDGGWINVVARADESSPWISWIAGQGWSDTLKR